MMDSFDPSTTDADLVRGFIEGHVKRDYAEAAIARLKARIAAQPYETEAELAVRIAELERERDHYRLHFDQFQARCERLRTALAAYRSALRSGERETPKLAAHGDAALAEEPYVDYADMEVTN